VRDFARIESEVGRDILALEETRKIPQGPGISSGFNGPIVRAAIGPFQGLARAGKTKLR
jgi:hypothetical protein